MLSFVFVSAKIYVTVSIVAVAVAAVFAWIIVSVISSIFDAVFKSITRGISRQFQHGIFRLFGNTVRPSAAAPRMAPTNSNTPSPGSSTAGTSTTSTSTAGASALGQGVRGFLSGLGSFIRGLETVSRVFSGARQARPKELPFSIQHTKFEWCWEEPASVGELRMFEVKVSLWAFYQNLFREMGNLHNVPINPFMVFDRHLESGHSAET